MLYQEQNFSLKISPPQIKKKKKKKKCLLCVSIAFCSFAILVLNTIDTKFANAKC